MIEGDAPLPRLYPPYVQGLFARTPESGWSAGPGAGAPPTTFDAANPTLVNNVETLATVTHVLRRGAEWHRALGTRQSAGAAVCTVVGDVVTTRRRRGRARHPARRGHRPGRRRCGAGTLGEGGAVGRLQPGPDRRSARRAGQLRGPRARPAAGWARAASSSTTTPPTPSSWRVLSRFLYVESCGQCPACKLGTGEITAQLASLLERAGGHRRRRGDRRPAPLGHRRQPLLPPDRGAEPDQQPAAGLSRRLRPCRSRADRARPRGPSSRSWSTSPTAWPPTTSVRLESNPTGPTPDRDRAGAAGLSPPGPRPAARGGWRWRRARWPARRRAR